MSKPPSMLVAAISLLTSDCCVLVSFFICFFYLARRFVSLVFVQANECECEFCVMYGLLFLLIYVDWVERLPFSFLDFERKVPVDVSDCLFVIEMGSFFFSGISTPFYENVISFPRVARCFLLTKILCSFTWTASNILPFLILYLLLII